jgi:hypothetical protein
MKPGPRGKRKTPQVVRLAGFFQRGGRDSNPSKAEVGGNFPRDPETSNLAEVGVTRAKSPNPGRVIAAGVPVSAPLVTGASPLFRLLELAGQAPRAALPGLGAELATLVSPMKAVMP